MGVDNNGVYLVVFKKAPKMAKKWLLTKNNVVTDWDKIKDDLESLSEPQLKLVLELVEHIKKVNEEYPSESTPKHK